MLKTTNFCDKTGLQWLELLHWSDRKRYSKPIGLDKCSTLPFPWRQTHILSPKRRDFWIYCKHGRRTHCKQWNYSKREAPHIQSFKKLHFSAKLYL